MAKSIRISDDNGVTWSTLPGSSGELATEAGSISDTIFGQEYSSTQSGLISWNLSANGLYKGFAGYVATLKISGTPIAMVAEPMSVVSGKTYQITAPTKRMIDPGTAVSVLDNAAPVAVANIQNIDYLYGRVTFKSTYVPTGPITISGSYTPLATIARANGFTLTQTTNAVDDTDFETAQSNSGTKVFIAGLKTVSLALTGIMSTGNNWRTLLFGRNRVLIEINPDGQGKSVARGFFKPTSAGQSGDVGDQESATATFPLSVPDNDLLAYPFAWLHDPSTTLNAAVRKALTAWQNNFKYDYQYLQDGTNGYQGDGIITDLSLAGGLEVMNSFTVNVQGSGTLSAVP
jgi:hypothetical protein